MKNKKNDYPKTIEEAADLLISSLSEKERQELINMPEEKLLTLHFTLGMYIRNTFGLLAGNMELLDACCPGWLQHPDEASMVIKYPLGVRLR
jgi:hypothetical protein